MRDNSIRSIETKYKGYRFRSRLEARWAVFFNELEIPFEYELEGFELPSGKRYLPDFFLPSLELFVEVKPSAHMALDDLAKMAEFAAQNRLLLLIGTPTTHEMLLLEGWLVRPQEWREEFGEDASEEEILESVLEGLRDYGNVAFGQTPFSPSWTLVFENLPPNDDYALKSALLKAKQARFEFGERG